MDRGADAAGPRPARPRVESQHRRGRAYGRRHRARRGRRQRRARGQHRVPRVAVHDDAAPANFSYTDQDVVPALPASGRAMVFLEVFYEHLQPAEDWDEIVDPALDPVDAAARTRV